MKVRLTDAERAVRHDGVVAERHEGDCCVNDG